MSTSISFKKEISSTLDSAIEQVTTALKSEGFGVLTRIDLHLKIKEKIGKDLRPVVILGACNPELAYEAYQQNSDVACLLPCNAVVRDIGDGRVSVELVKPTAMMEMLGDRVLVTLAKDADERLKKVLDKI